MADLTAEERAELRRLCGEAHPEMWDYDETHAQFYNDADGNSHGGGSTGIYEVWESFTIPSMGGHEPVDDVAVFMPAASKAVAKFVVKGCQAIPHLLDQVETLEARLQQAERERDEVQAGAAFAMDNARRQMAEPKTLQALLEAEAERWETIGNLLILCNQSEAVSKCNARAVRLRGLAKAMADRVVVRAFYMSHPASWDEVYICHDGAFGEWDDRRDGISALQTRLTEEGRGWPGEVE